MSKPGTTRYLICYDIRCDERRTRVATMLEDHGTRVQFSVFECDLKERPLLRLRRRLLRAIDQDTDSIRIYTLCLRCECNVDVFGSGPILADDRVLVL